MKRKILLLGLLLAFAAPRSHAQWTVVDPTNLVQNIISALQTTATAENSLSNFKETVKVYEQHKDFYDALKQVKNLVRDARKVQQTILIVGDITDIYVSNFQRMTADPNFAPDELSAIAAGYAILLGETANTLADLKTVINVNGLSMNDKERMDVIDKCYAQVFEYRALTQYYTNKNIGVSYLRAKKRNDTDRVLSLYGSPADRYW